MNSKYCCICKQALSLESFNKRKLSKDGLRSECKLCRKKQRNINIERAKSLDKISRDRHKDKRRLRSKIYFSNNRENKKLYDNIYYTNNKNIIINKHSMSNKLRRKNDIIFYLRGRISTMIGCALKKNSSSKSGMSILKYLPYTITQLKQYLESLFEPWMTWENHGSYNRKQWNDNNLTTWTWQLDHIMPQSELPYTSMEDENFKKCWALENLRPYSAKQNILDGTRRIRHNTTINI